MRRTSIEALALVVTLFASGSASAQVQAGQASKEDIARAELGASNDGRTVVPNPMLLSVSLRHVGALQDREMREYKETNAYSCDQAVVERVAVQRLSKVGKKKVTLKIFPRISSGWYRQDIDLTMELLTSEGESVIKRSWDNLTIGNAKGPYSGTSREPEMFLELPSAQFAQVFDAAQPPVLKVLVEIQSEDHDEGND